ncbi:ATP-binding protein [Methanobacterium sp. MBAC-LM]|uniref:ATP-binding protein n=1 Tax=Methanobacterium sp. MBAC-LM TaxID=3412034 RepID=UPI003C737A96
MQSNILVVEDEAITALDIRRLLENMGFEIVSTASTGIEAIQKARDLKPDIIIMDVTLQGEIDGIEAAERIIDIFDIPVIYLTGYSDEKTFERIKLTRPYGFVTKPIGHNELRATIETALYKHKLDKELAASEEKLRNSNERYEEFFNNPLMGFALCEIITDNENNPIDFIYLNVNPAFEDFTGLKKDKIVNKRVTDILPLEEVEEVIKIYGKVALTGESTNFEYPVPSLGKYYEIAAFSPKKQRFIAFFTDITKYKKVEDEVRQAYDNLEVQVQERTEELYLERQRLFDVLETLPVIIALLTHDYHVVFANHAFRKRFGEAQGRHCYEYIFGGDKPCKWCEIHHVFETGQPHFWEFTTPDGSIIDAYDFPFTDVDGSQLVLEMDIDVTEQKKNEKERETLIKELKRSNDELQSFAYITSHDLQEPLRTIASYAQLIQRRYKGKLDHDADEFIEFMVDGASRMKEMIQGLLDYSRVGTNGHGFKEFQTETALNYALSNLGSVISDTGAEITHDSLPVIFADESQIIRIFQNLIGNAIKFCRDEVTPKIHVSAKKKYNEHVFSVSDNGIGLEEEYSDKIFEVFKRLNAIGEYQGAGIGLAIVKRIIDRHGGRIWVESELENGSTFYFAIPIK